MNCIDSLRECEFWVVLIGLSVSLVSEEVEEVQSELLKISTFGAGWGVNV